MLIYHRNIDRKRRDLELEEINLAEAKLLKAKTKILKTAFIVSIDLKKHLDLRLKGGI